MSVLACLSMALWGEMVSLTLHQVVYIIVYPRPVDSEARVALCEPSLGVIHVTGSTCLYASELVWVSNIHTQWDCHLWLNYGIPASIAYRSLASHFCGLTKEIWNFSPSVVWILPSNTIGYSFTRSSAVGLQSWLVPHVHWHTLVLCSSIVYLWAVSCLDTGSLEAIYPSL